MEQAAYRDLVATLEQDARRDPDGMRRRIFGLVALGYVYVLGVLGVLVLVTAVMIVASVKATSAVLAWKVAVPLIVVVGLILKALWVPAEAPQGVQLPRGRAPELDRRVEELRAALRAPRPDAVLLTEDFNAAVTQIPQLGVFGFPRTYLILGVPLMYALTPAQFDAVLAHEFGHLSGAHPKRGLWVYRIYQTWYRLMMQMEETKSWAAGFFDRFVRWYVPRLNAYGFVMSRHDEYAADADAARVTSPAALGGALVALELRGRAYVESIWRGIWARADHEPDPPSSAWATVPTLLRETDRHPERSLWLGHALLARARENDTHPSLHERLQALGLVAPDAREAAPTAEGLVEALETSAADRYLGEVAAERLSSLDAVFRSSAAEKWRERFEQVRQMRLRLAGLRAQDALGELTDARQIGEMGFLAAELESEDAAVPVLERAIGLIDDYADAHFVLGRILLARNDPAGEAHVRRALALEPQAAYAGATILGQYFERVGRTEDMEEIVRWYHQTEADRVEGQQERAGLREIDQFVAPVLTDTDVRAIHAAIQATPGVKSVVLAFKVVKHRPQVPLLIILVERQLRAIVRSSSYPDLPRRFIDALRLESSMDIWAELEADENAWVRRALRQMGGARQFARDGREQTFGAR